LPKWRQRRWRKCEKKESAARVADYSSHLHFFSWMLYHDHAIDIKRVCFDTNTLNLRAQKNILYICQAKSMAPRRKYIFLNTHWNCEGKEHTNQSSKKCLAWFFFDFTRTSRVLNMWWNARPKIGLLAGSLPPVRCQLGWKAWESAWRYASEMSFTTFKNQKFGAPLCKKYIKPWQRQTLMNLHCEIFWTVTWNVMNQCKFILRWFISALSPRVWSQRDWSLDNDTL
jgi:hypothetical protein